MMMKGLVLLAAVAGSMFSVQLRSAAPTSAASEDARQQMAEVGPADAIAEYNRGTALVLDSLYEEARPHLERAARLLDDSQRGAASYNLGATDLEPAYLDDELAERDDRLRRAIESYKQALLADPGDMDAKWNLELARRLLERESDASSGGGGGSGGGQGQPMPGAADPLPAPAARDGSEPQMSETEAEDLLRSARDQEFGVQRDRLRKPQPPGPIRP